MHCNDSFVVKQAQFNQENHNDTLMKVFARPTSNFNNSLQFCKLDFFIDPVSINFMPKSCKVLLQVMFTIATLNEILTLHMNSNFRSFDKQFLFYNMKQFLMKDKWINYVLFFVFYRYDKIIYSRPFSLFIHIILSWEMIQFPGCQAFFPFSRSGLSIFFRSVE